MTIPHVLELVAFVLAAVELIRSRGLSLLAWAVVFLALALLWGLLGA
ncbi:MAG TPA: hypothetical protein VIU37_03295 [Candidatus Limnocylindrales bacterium]